MRTDSLLTADDRALVEGWRSPNAQKVNTYVRLARELERLEKANDVLSTRTNFWMRSYEAATGDLNTTRDALTAARAEVQRLRDELDAEKIASTYWQDQYNIRNDVAISVGDQLAAARAEVQRLRGELEKDKPEATPDAGLRSRVATLEGRVQGIIEGTKARMDSMDARLASLEAGIRAPRSFTTGSGYGQSGSS